MIDVVLFDLGDTLFRLMPMPDVTEEFARHLAAEGVPDAEDEAARILNTFREALMAGYGRGDLLEPAIADVVHPFIGPDAKSRALAERLDALLGQADIERWEQADERELVFEHLRSRGLRVGYVSNTLTAPLLMNSRLADFDLLGQAEVAVFSVEQGVRKPNPKIYHAALKALNAEPSRTLFIGDRVREDVHGPQAVGMQGILTHEFRQEDPANSAPLAVIPHLRDLLPLIE
jgi:putative hydrolase of the HAD superfamily